jgi:hypothetical protein
MQVPNDRIDEFIVLWEQAFGERITRDDARARAHQLVELYRFISRDLPPERRDETPPPATERPTPEGAPGGGTNGLTPNT